MYHTIGQRQGLGIGGMKDASDDPWYVLAKDLARNVLIVGQGNENPWLYSRALKASEIYWVNPIDLDQPRRLKAKVRYRQSDQPCTLEKTADGYVAVFDEAQRAVTPGQSVVFYDGEICLGGGVIESAEPRDSGVQRP
ncbi:tRNA-specific 2-thiouridylase MnmA [compost metagenome]